MINYTTTLNNLIKNHKTSVWIDDAIFMLAEILEKKLNNTEDAKKLYQQLINDYSGGMLTAEASKLLESSGAKMLAHNIIFALCFYTM